MKKIFLLSLSLGFITISCAQKKQSVKEYEVREESVAATLRFLSSDELQGRDSGSEGIEEAAKYLEEIFEKNSIGTYFITYRDTLSNFEKPAYNLVGLLEGTDPKLKNEFVVIGAHYDHVGIAPEAVNGDTIKNGADDNASGTTVVAELVNYFGKRKTNKRSILFCFFSAEEKGLLGSKHLAAKLKQAGVDIYTMLNFEMVGVPLNKDITAFMTGYGRSNMGEKLNGYAGEKFIGSTEFEMRYQLFKASDNYPFFTEFNIPAHTLSTTDMETFQYYHHVDDEFEIMDTGHMTKFIQKMIPVTEKMVNAPTREITLKE